MDNRNDLLKNILPKIEFIRETESENETFQNDVLRPILKFQNDLIIQTFEIAIIENKIDFHKLKHHLKVAKVHDLFKSNIQFKQFNLGFIVAYFTTENFLFYTQNKKEVNKRIIALLIERICSQIEIVRNLA